MRRGFWVWFLVILLTVMSERMLFVLLPNFLLNIRFSASQIGLMFSFASLLLILSRFFVGRLSDVWGRKGIMSIGLLLQSVFVSLYPHLQSIYTFGLVKGLKEASETLSKSVKDSMLADTFRKKERAKVMAKLGSLLPLGRALGSLAGFIITLYFALATGFYLASFLVLGAFLVLVFFFPERFPKKAVRSGVSLTLKQYSRNMVLVAIIGFLLSVSYTAAYFPAFFILARSLGITTSLLFLLLLGDYIISWVFAYSSHRWIDRISKTRIIVGTSAVFSVLTVLYPFASDVLQFFLVLVGISLAFYVWRIAFKVVMMDASKPGVRGEQIGFVKTLQGLGDVAGPVVGGFLIDLISLSSAFWVAGSVGLIGAACGLLLKK